MICNQESANVANCYINIVSLSLSSVKKDVKRRVSQDLELEPGPSCGKKSLIQSTVHKFSILVD